MIGGLSGRELAPTELEAVARSFGERPELWRHLVRHDERQRAFEQLHLDEHVGVWLLCWLPGQDTGFHDHDISFGAFVTVEGELIEERLRFGAPPTALHLGEGESVHFRPTDIHRVLHTGEAPAVSIHAYSPPLIRMGSYLFEPGGALLRHPMEPTEELRPLASVA